MASIEAVIANISMFSQLLGVGGSLATRENTASGGDCSLMWLYPLALNRWMMNSMAPIPSTDSMDMVATKEKSIVDKLQQRLLGYAL